LIIDIDASLVTSHSGNPPTRKGLDFIRCSPSSTTATVAPVSLWPSCCVLETRDHTAADHISLVKLILDQLPGSNPRPGKSVLIRTDTAGGTHDFVEFLTKRRLSYSVGWMLPGNTPELYRQLSELGAWEPAYDTNAVLMWPN
jgi:hypothetical protein